MDSAPLDRSGSPPDPRFHTNPDRWSELVEGVGPAAMKVVIASSMSRALRDHASPEDIWQETRGHAWRDRDRHTWAGVPAFRAWLFEIARNRILEAARNMSAIKRGAGARAQPLPSAPESSCGAVAGFPPVDSVTPSRILGRGEKRAALERALAELPSDVAQVVRLHLLEERTMESVAERLGIGLSAAWRRFRRGSEILARILPDWVNDGSSGAW